MRGPIISEYYSSTEGVGAGAGITFIGSAEWLEHPGCHPRETEEALVAHPAVLDAAVIGVPSPDLGEEVKAVVQAAAWPVDEAALDVELLAFCRAHRSALKGPRSIDFMETLPRIDTGKLYTRALRDRYRADDV